MEKLQKIAKTKHIHIAVMSEPFLTYIFDGKKTIESRFSLHKIAPYGKIQPEDVVFMKANAIVGCFTVAWVKYFDLSEYPIEKIKQEYGDAICGNVSFWRIKSEKRYATLIGISKVERLTPLTVDKRDRRAWVSSPVIQGIIDKI